MSTGIVVHGGAGLITPDRFDRMRAGVRAAAAAGDALLAAGASALDAAVAAVRALEDDPEFNAGTGSALTRDGTVGAVARDRAGRFAAATSTGGISGKRAGRVGDSPLAGAGTWADDACAISATGDGEAIIRMALAHSLAVSARHDPLADAARAVLVELRRVTAGNAGLIALTRTAFAAVQLSPAMPIAWIVDADRGDSIGAQIA